MAEANTEKRKKHVRQIYWPNCSVCKFMKKNPTFRLRVMQSKYFQPSGHESLATVVHDFGDPFKLAAIYMHMQRHQAQDLIAAKKRFDSTNATGNPHNSSPVVPIAAVEGEVVSQGEHESALDEFIREGHEKLMRKEMPISATTFLAAIKIRSEINKSAKDRRLDMIKSFFAGGDSAKKDG